MDYLLYIQEYYFHLIAFIGVLTFLSFHSYVRKNPEILINILTISFALFTVYYIGGRDVSIGVDTIHYEKGFRGFEYAKEFEIRKDPFYDFISYVFAKLFNFHALLLFCAFLYVFGALYGLKKIFKENYYLPFLVFLISPYFMAWGVNVMRSGVAASLFLVGLGVYYDKGKTWQISSWFLLSALFHFSMIIPLFFFFLTRYIKNTKIVFLTWLASIVLSILKINIIIILIGYFDLFASRMNNYAVNEGERAFWGNFLIFGFIPVIFAVYNIVVLKYKNDFYKWLVNAYMLIHVPYIILLNSQYGLRLGYLAEFMMPIILLFPLLINPKLKIKYPRLKLSLLIFLVFMIKGYNILIM